VGDESPRSRGADEEELAARFAFYEDVEKERPNKKRGTVV
jgi:hypothetical protein